MRRFTFMVAALAAMAVIPNRASAQTPLEPGTVSISPTLGIAFDPDADVSLTLAGAGTYAVTTAFGVEAELGHVFDMAGDDPDVDSSLTTVHAAVLYFFETDYVLVPYVAGGVGFGRFSHTVAAPPAKIGQTEIGINLGGGIAYPLQDRIWLRGDIRYFKHIDDVPSIWRFGASVIVRIGG